MAKIFISYNRQSETVARGLAADVEALGHTVWIDQELSGGQVWWEQILSTIRACDVLIFVLDTSSLNSTACKRELGYAADLGKSILPVLATDGISTNLLPSALSQIQFVDYRKKDRDAVLRLARAFTMLPPPKPLPDALPTPPEAPLSYLGTLTERIDKSSTLTYEEQSALIVDLRRSVRDPETQNDALTLLKKLRRRRDLLAPVADEIDEILRRPTETAPAHHAVSEPTPSIQPQANLHARQTALPSQDVKTHHQNVGSPKSPPEARLPTAAVAALLGSILMALALTVSPTSSTRSLLVPLSFAFGALPWAIAGAITARRPKVIGVALATAAVGFVFGWFVFSDIGEPDALAAGMAWGAGPAVVLGALAGAVWIRRRGSAASPIEL
jgi:TIR domain